MGSAGWKFALSGAAMWAVGTVFFYFRAGHTFERGPLLYAINASATVLLFVLAFRGLAIAFKAPRAQWCAGALCFILPGMLGEIPILLNFSRTLPTLAPGSGANYAAFLFCGYAAVGLYALTGGVTRDTKTAGSSSPGMGAR